MEEMMDVVTVLQAHARAEDKQKNLFASKLALRASHEIESLRTLAREASEAWDSDSDTRVGKLLRAMLDDGFRGAYRPDLRPNTRNQRPA